MHKVVQVNISITKSIFVMNMDKLFHLCNADLNLVHFQSKKPKQPVYKYIYHDHSVHRAYHSKDVFMVINPFSNKAKIVQQFHYQSLCSNYSQVLSHGSHSAPPIAIDGSDVFIVVYSYRKYSSISVQFQISSMSCQPVTTDSIERLNAVMISTQHTVGTSNWRFKIFKTIDGSNLIVPKNSSNRSQCLTFIFSRVQGNLQYYTGDSGYNVIFSQNLWSVWF